jgi:hypothetical protein
MVALRSGDPIQEDSMRATLFLSALFCGSLIAGTALAEKPHAELRTKGDLFEKHAKADKTKAERQVKSHVDKAQTPLKIRQAAERIRCSEAQEDCGRGGVAKSAASKADKSDKAVVSKNASGADAAKLRAVMQKMLSSKCGARARGGCSGHDDPY